jgi:hypothetical protein
MSIFKLGQYTGDPFEQISKFVNDAIRKIGCVKGCAVTSSIAPTVSNIPAGSYTMWKNTGDGTVKLYFNDNGTLKSTTLS